MEPSGPSVFTPFLRRFTDERAQDLGDLRALLDEVLALNRRSVLSGDSAALDLGWPIYKRFSEGLPRALDQALAQTFDGIIGLEPTIFGIPDTDWNLSQLSLKEQVDLQRFLLAKRHVLTNEKRILGLFTDGLERLLGTIFDGAPAFGEASSFTIPFILTLPQPRQMLDRLYAIVWHQPFIDAGLFVELGRIMHHNICVASKIDDPSNPKNRPFVIPSAKDRSVSELVDVYFKGTPFHALFNAPVPLRIGYEERFRHMHVVGGSGAGKTQFLQQLILNDLKSDDPPALVIVDSQTDMISKLSRLGLFEPDEGPLDGRLVLITPRDLKHPPALNIFDLNRGRIGSYDEVTREQVTAGVIQTFDYLFSGLFGADLTAKQGVFFRFVARLMLALPDSLGRNATILDMLALMDDPAPYRDAIARLPPIQRAFFERDFTSKTFAQTKEQIRYRLNAILENPTLARLFTSPATKVDLFTELNRGSIILIDTAQDFLKGASEHFGRIFISLVLQAVLERAALPEEERKPAFLIVDEAASYFDSNIDDLLTEARKYKLGCVFAHQFLDQCTGALRASLAANTAIKMASGVSMADARSLAPDMRTDAAFIQDQPRLQFAAHIRGVTPQAISLPVDPGFLERQSTMTPEGYERFRDENRLRVSAAGEPAKEVAESDLPPSAAVRDDDDLTAPKEW